MSVVSQQNSLLNILQMRSVLNRQTKKPSCSGLYSQKKIGKWSFRVVDLQGRPRNVQRCSLQVQGTGAREDP